MRRVTRRAITRAAGAERDEAHRDAERERQAADQGIGDGFCRHTGGDPADQFSIRCGDGSDRAHGGSEGSGELFGQSLR